MDSQRWRQIQGLFEEALEIPSAGRETFLKDRCGDDESLIQEVLSLLAADGGQHSLLDNQVSDMVSLSKPKELLGSTIGPYKIVETIASGGMGTVYLAERADGQFDRKVAVKLVRHGMDSEVIQRRFVAERQILAGLEHPNISRLIDGGLTDDGLPWFCMEYVDGNPIDRHCDMRQLSIEERLRLFLTVCRTVEHAQQNLVVHRDLKPSNILVSADGTVKLLDFGIAKLLGEKSAMPPPDLTHTGMRVMTPGYASPEQVRGDRINTSSDVYSLGVVLYNLLSGSPPYHIEQSSPSEIERVICHTEPRKPSAAITTPEGAEDAQSTAERRSTQPARLRRVLSGDLDNITLMALRKEPERRYQTAGQLADDISRYLEGLPVRARKSSLGYRSRKFVSRHRAAVFSAVAIFAVVAVLIGFYTDRLAHERDRARIEADKAAEVAGFLSSLFTVADPNESRGETVTARELLDRGARRIDEELANTPETQAAMMSLMGRVYNRLGMWVKAESLLVKSLDVTVATHGWDSPETADVLYHTAVLVHDLGKFDQAEDMYRNSLAINERIDRGVHFAVANSLNGLADVLKMRLHYRESRDLLEQALAMRIELYGEIHADVAHSMNHLGSAMMKLGESEEAEKVLRRGLEIRRQVYDSYHIEVVASLGKLGSLMMLQGKHAEAEELYLEALTIITQLMGENHHYTGGIINGLARTYLDAGQYKLADSLFRKSRVIMGSTLPENHLSHTYPLWGIGRVLTSAGRAEEAEPMLQKALQLYETILGSDHWQTARGRGALGICRSKLGRYREAHLLLTASLPVLESSYDVSPRFVAEVRRSLAETLDSLGMTGAADSLRTLPVDGRPVSSLRR